VDTFDLARASGCTGVFLGIESGDPGVCAQHGQGVDGRSVPARRGGAAREWHPDVRVIHRRLSGRDRNITAEITINFLNTAAPTLYRVEPWWYNHRAPIHRRAEELGLTGRAYDWRHATMSAEESCDGIDEIFASVTTSKWCPQQSFSFWALPYLMGKGMSTGELVTFHSLLHDLLPVSTGVATTGVGVVEKWYGGYEVHGGVGVVEKCHSYFTRRTGSTHALVNGLQLSGPRFTRPVARAH
jgi:p-methyltransferase